VGVHPAFQIDMANGQVWRLQYLRVIERDPVLAVGQLSVEDAVIDMNRPGNRGGWLV
jgi:hypothetical protein